MCICVFTVQSTHTEPMNFIAKDNNIYYPFESLVKVYAIALSVELWRKNDCEKNQLSMCIEPIQVVYLDTIRNEFLRK